jgi:hypothetical protein
MVGTAGGIVEGMTDGALTGTGIARFRGEPTSTRRPIIATPPRRHTTAAATERSEQTRRRTEHDGDAMLGSLLQATEAMGVDRPRDLDPVVTAASSISADRMAISDSDPPPGSGRAFHLTNRASNRPSFRASKRASFRASFRSFFRCEERDDFRQTKSS